jgi:SAM-dependent methyltransferase
MRAFRRLSVAVCVSMLWMLGVVHAQPAKKEAPAAGDKEFVPEVGQSGKDVVWVPTGLTLVNKMLDMAKLTPQDIVYDLGSGDGRTVITAAKRGATAFGVEYNPDMVALSRRNATKEGVSNKATFVQGDIFQTDFSRATVLTLFLLPELNVKLRPTILDMKPGTRVAANSFDMGDWKPDQTARVDGDCGAWCTAYLWIVPAKVAGAWKLAHGELTLTQQYQTIAGTLRMNDRTLAISNGKLDGEAISFSVGGVQYTGRVSGNSMDGTMAAGATRSPWSASRAAGGK